MKPINNFENYFITLDGKVINRTTKKCRKPTSNIVAMLKGRQAYTGNFTWCYVEESKGD